VTPASREVSLAELLQYAERHGPSVAVAHRQRAYGAAALENASVPLRENPTLEFSIGPRFDSMDGAANYDVVAGLEQPIEIAGQRGLRIEAAHRLRQRIDAEAGTVLWKTRQEVVHAFRAAIVARERVKVAARALTFATDMLRIAQRRHAAGDIAGIDVQIAEVDVAQGRQAKLVADQELRSFQLALCEITGWPVGSPPLPQGELAIPLAVPQLANALRLASERHPELRARRAAVLETHARVELEDREAWPTPTFGVSFAREGNLREPENYIVLGTVGMQLPLWQVNQGGRAQARADESVARAEEAATLHIVRARIARAHSRLRSAHERVALYASGVTPALDQALASLRRGFDAGEIPIFNVTVVVERVLQAQRDALSAHADYYDALVELETAMGTELSPENSNR
jgi:cobalt-zinc-cadmium efflux system outer membrane protein